MNTMIDYCDIAYQSSQFKIEQDVFGDHYEVVIYATDDKVHIIKSPCAGCIGDSGDEKGELEERIMKLIQKKAELIRWSRDTYKIISARCREE